MSALAGATLGLAFAGPVDRTAWSGTPAGLVEGLAAHDVRVVHLRAAPPERIGRLATRLPGWRLTPVLHTRALARAQRRAGGERLDGIVVVGSLAAIAADVPVVTYEDMTVRQARALGDPFVCERPQAEVEAWIERQAAIYRGAAGICTMGRWAADSVVADYGLPRARVHVVGAGVNHVVAPAPRDWSRPRFLFVGRDFARKNGPAVLRAFAEVRAQRPDATLDVVGEHPPLDAPGVTGHGYLALSDDAGRSRLDALFRSATCFVMPSRYEPFGIVYTEAGSAGVPSIATAVGGSFVDETCGRRVDPGDGAALLAAMRELSDGALAQQLGARAAERARLYSWPLVAGRLLRTFATAAGRPADGLPGYL